MFLDMTGGRGFTAHALKNGGSGHSVCTARNIIILLLFFLSETFCCPCISFIIFVWQYTLLHHEGIFNRLKLI